MGRTGSAGQILKPGLACLAALALSACALSGPKGPSTRPKPRALPPVETPVAATPSEASRAVETHFARVQEDLLSRGLLRVDGGGPDAPWGPRELAENFVRIALHDEYVSEGGRLVARQTPAPLRRWAAPIRIGLRFGASVPEETRVKDRAAMTSLVSRLARHSGHPIRISDQSPNYWVYVVSEDERRTKGQEWAALFPGLAASDLGAATDMELSTFCMVLAISEGRSPVYTGALAVIRAELPDLLRMSCLHEEVTQGLGLANDHYQARPSIFNDDEEFATLTGLDEKLLRVLYDKRLRPGMREAEVRPLLGPIVDGLLPGGS